jgi:hypothetical protein
MYVDGAEDERNGRVNFYLRQTYITKLANTLHVVVDLDGDRETNGWAVYLLVYCDTTDVSGLAAIVRMRNAFVAGDRCSRLMIAHPYLGERKVLALLLQDNAVPHKAATKHQNLADLHFEVLKRPDLICSDYYLFPNVKKNLKRRQTSSNEKATLAADGWFAAQQNNFS